MPTKMNSNGVCVLGSVGITQTCPFCMQQSTHTSSVSDLSMYCLPFVSKDASSVEWVATLDICVIWDVVVYGGYVVEWGTSLY